MILRLIILSLSGAFTGWLFIRIAIRWLFHPKEPKAFAGIKIQGIFPARQQQFADSLGKLVSEQLFSFQSLEAKITNPENIQKVMPHVEGHIDHFLRVKLKETMPMISMFIGDKTINELKGVFMTELELLFPQILSNYMVNLEQDLDLKKMVTDKVAGISPEQLEGMLKQGLARELRSLEIAGALMGWLIALLQIGVMLLLNRTIG
jgi:uncharacterized membrane protein YheB (UPF0754 family)